MKIGIVVPGGFDRSGERRVIPLLMSYVEHLARRHEVHVFALHQYPEPCRYTLVGSAVHNVGGMPGRTAGPRRLAAGMRAVRREHRIAPFDALHGMWISVTGLIAAAAGRVLGVRSVATLSGGELMALPEIDYGGQLRRSERMWVRLTLRLASRVTGPTEHARRLLLAHRPDAARIVMGVDCSRFTPRETMPSGPPWRLLHVASLNRVKDQPTLLRAIRRMRDTGLDCCVDIVGEDTLSGAIQTQASDLGLAGVVAFRGYESHAVVRNRMRDGHVLLQSSRYEAAGAVVMEAAACAVPTVGTAVGYVSDMAPGAAISVRVQDDQALAQSTANLLHDHRTRASIGESALEFARCHDVAQTVSRFEELYAYAA